MKLALLRKGEYPEAVRAELEQLVASITASHTIEHDAEGRQRIVCGKWTLGADQSIPDATLTRITVAVPHATNVPGGMTIEAGTGLVRVQMRGVYQVIGQVTHGASAAGVRGVQLTQNGVQIALVTQTAIASARLQATETVVAAVGDTFGVWGYQTSGGALSVASASNQTFLRIARVG